MHSDVAAQAAELASINRSITSLETRIAALEKSAQRQEQASAHWTLWQVTEAVNAGYPTALAAYFAKGECVTAASEWSFAGGTAVSQDPTIFQLKGYRIRLECLPVGTTPYAH
jgi:hypothetical protein